VVKHSVTTTSKEKQMEDKYMEPTECDWCGKEYELSEGTKVMGDNLCPNCTSIYEEERDVY
jgi:predicted Zn-ribbon and HTH transcriptional regulator